MEKRTPHCTLPRVKALIEAGKVRLTASAVIGARQMGFTEAETIDVVRALTPFEFHKSMTTYADHTIWQDRLPALHDAWRRVSETDRRRRCADRVFQGAMK